MTQPQETTSPAATTLDPAKKTFVVSMHALFAAGRPDDFNRVNTGLVEEMKQNGNVILLYAGSSWAFKAKYALDETGADEAIESLALAQESTFTDMLTTRGLDPKTALFIAEGSALADSVAKEGLNVYETTSLVPSAMIGDEKQGNLDRETRAELPRLRTAIKDFMLA